MNPIIALRKGYFDALEGNITVDMITIPIYDGVNPNEESMYIVLAERSATQEDNKCGFDYSCTMLVDCIVKSTNFGYYKSDDIAEQVLGFINSNSLLDLTAYGFEMVSTELTDTNNLTSLNPEDGVFRTLLRFSHKLHKI